MADFLQILLLRLLGTSCRKKSLAAAPVYWKKKTTALVLPLCILFGAAKLLRSGEVFRHWETMDVKLSVIWNTWNIWNQAVWKKTHASGSRAWGTWWDRRYRIWGVYHHCRHDRTNKSRVKSNHSKSSLKSWVMRELGKPPIHQIIWVMSHEMIVMDLIVLHIWNHFRLPTCCAFLVASCVPTQVRGPAEARAARERQGPQVEVEDVSFFFNPLRNLA